MNTSEEQKVSVIIPTYNRARFLPDAVNSVLKQDYKNTEIIVVDDGSEDNTKEVIRSLQDGHPQILYFQNERSKGPSGARNTGLLKATGDFIAFLDSDDVWLEHHLAEGMEIFSEYPEIDVLFGNFSVYEHKNKRFLYNFFDQKKILHTLKSKELTENVRLLNDNLFIALLKENFFHLGSAIIKKSVLNGITLDDSVMYAEDRDLAIKLFKKSKATFAFRKEPVFIAYKHTSNTYSSKQADIMKRVIETHLYLFKKYLQSFELLSSEKRVLTKSIVNTLSTLSYINIRNKQNKKAVSEMLESFQYGLTIVQLKNIIKSLIAFLSLQKVSTSQK